jgi:hypothetical protein
MDPVSERTSYELPVVEVVGTEAKDLAGRLTPETAAAQLKAIRVAFLKVLNDKAESGAFELREVDLAVTVSASGSIAWLTAAAEGSLTLRFRPA